MKGLKLGRPALRGFSGTNSLLLKTSTKKNKVPNRAAKKKKRKRNGDAVEAEDPGPRNNTLKTRHLSRPKISWPSKIPGESRKNKENKQEEKKGGWEIPLPWGYEIGSSECGKGEGIKPWGGIGTKTIIEKKHKKKRGRRGKRGDSHDV